MKSENLGCAQLHLVQLILMSLEKHTAEMLIHSPQMLQDQSEQSRNFWLKHYNICDYGFLFLMPDFLLLMCVYAFAHCLQSNYLTVFLLLTALNCLLLLSSEYLKFALFRIIKWSARTTVTCVEYCVIVKPLISTLNHPC